MKARKSLFWLLILSTGLLASVTLAENQRYIKENVELQFVLSPSQTSFYEFANYPLTDPTYLWSYRWVEVVSPEKGEFSVYYSTSEAAIRNYIDNPDSEEPTEEKVHHMNCVGLFESASSQDSCRFALSFYGESPWWYPRVESAFQPPPNTVIAIHIHESSLGFISGRSTRFFTMKVNNITPWRQYIATFAVGAILYALAVPLSKSLTFYLLLWFFGGALMGVMTIALCLFLFLSRQVNTGMTLTSLITLTFVGWGAIWVTNGFPTWVDLFTNKWAVGFMALGGLTGLWKGYTDHLTDQMKSRTQLFLRLLSLGCIFNSIQQSECGLALVIGLLVLGLFPLHTLLYLFFPLVYPFFACWNRIKWHVLPKRKRKVITMEEYLVEGETETKNALDELVSAYKRQPALLFDLSRTARRRLVKMIDDPHITTCVKEYEKQFVKRGKVPKPSKMEQSNDEE